MLARRYIAAGDACGMLKKDTSLIISYYEKSFAILKMLPDKMTLRDYYLRLSGYYYEHKNYDAALTNYKKFILYKDSIISGNTAASIAEIATKYETRKKDAEITLLSTNEKIRLLEIEKQKAIIAKNILEAKRKQDEIALLSQQRELQESKLKQQGEQLEKELLVSKNNQQQLELTRQGKELKEKELKAQKQLRNFIIGAAIALLFLGAFMFNRYQLKKKLSQQEEMLAVRNNIARDLHDEIGSTLTSIKILSEVSKNNLQKDQQKASAMLAKITEQSEQMQQGMSDIVWAIKPDNDKLENMLIRMRDYTAHMLKPKDISVSFVADDYVLGKSLDMQQRRDLFLIFKESVNNAVKYSGATAMQIRLYKDSNNIVLEVADNGKGFGLAAKTRGNGLKNMRARALSLKGKFEIVSGENNGTCITVTIAAT